jgi:DNA-binding CsgD family transcriptional regulator
LVHLYQAGAAGKFTFSQKTGIRETRCGFLPFFSLTAVITACWSAQRLAKTFRFHFLTSYFSFLVTINIFAFLNLMLGEMSTDILKNISPQNMRPVYILFGLAAFPLLAVAYYFLWDFVAGILDRELSRLFRGAYAALWIVLMTMFLIRIQFAVQKRYLPWSNVLSIASGLGITVMPIAAWGYLAWRASRAPRAVEKKGLLSFAAVSLTCYFLFFLTLSVIPSLVFTSLAVPVGLFVANIVPVLVLKRFLAKYYRPLFPDVFGGSAAEQFCLKHRLSKREGEILALLLKGKSHKEIERDLFISPHTIRNHAHNIYQKLEVSSRLQLMHIVRSWLNEKNP